MEDGHRIGKGAGPDLNKKKSWLDHGDDDDDDPDDPDDVQPVAHEVEVKGKLVGQLHSHSHLNCRFLVQKLNSAIIYRCKCACFYLTAMTISAN